jgi:hypothetical protein
MELPPDETEPENSASPQSATVTKQQSTEARRNCTKTENGEAMDTQERGSILCFLPAADQLRLAETDSCADRVNRLDDGLSIAWECTDGGRLGQHWE